MSKTTLVFLLVGLVIAYLFSILVYRDLLKKRIQSERVFGDVESKLKKRFALLPKLIALLAPHLGEDQDSLDELTMIHSKVTVSHIDRDDIIRYDNEISGHITAIMANSAGNKGLLSSQSYQELQKELDELDNDLNKGRMAYNSTAIDYNNTIDLFPQNAIALIVNFHKRPLFDIRETAREGFNMADIPQGTLDPDRE